MNDFIVWYSDENNENKFSREFTLDELISQNHLDEIADSPLLKNFKVDSINNGIGIKDINDKNIFVDCSIFEFESKILDSHIQRYGYFYYNKEFARHEVKTRYISEIENLEWNIVYDERIANIKIIDTIQENKLGLIK